MRSKRLTAMALIMATTVGLLPAAQAGWLDDLLGRNKEDKASTANTSSIPSAAALTSGQIGAGLKEALEVGTTRVVDSLGQTDGFNADPLIHIPLPSSLQSVRSALDRVGMAGKLDELELELNRAAEVATPQAKSLFINAIRELTIDDVMGIYNGPEDAATTYLRSKMSAPLADAMQPIVDQSLDEVGAAQTYTSVMGQYNALPFVPQVDADLSGYVVDKGLDGIFVYLAREEAAIRSEPLKRSTDLLKQVFGAL
jgi:hypothetical protein